MFNEYSYKINYGPVIKADLCSGCRKCYDVCPCDVFGWDAENKRPTVDYAGECDMCCFCEIYCPEVAIDVKIPVHNMLDFGASPLDYKPMFDRFQE